MKSFLRFLGKILVARKVLETCNNENFSISIIFDCSTHSAPISHLHDCNKMFDENQITKLNTSYFSISMIYEFQELF